MVLGGCRPSPWELRQQIQAEDPATRVKAIIHAGRVGDQKAVPLLIDRLEDEDEAVRFFAILALEKITGKTMGYYYYEDRQRRLEAVKRWRSWLLERSAEESSAQQNGQDDGSAPSGKAHLRACGNRLADG